MPIDIDSLNGPQREAVVTTEGPLLVLAGAGSGKTRVLTYRIANLIENHNVAPWEILAITFTNKAAAEMRERLNGLVGPRSRGMWVSTFHSMCVRMLRSDADKLGFTRNFTIYDVDDQKRLYKEIMAEFDIDPKRFPVNALMNRISTAKNELVVPSAFEKEANDPVGKVAARVYGRLQERLKAANAFDFDDLLLYAFLLLKNHEDVLQAYQNRFRYIMVDEYQDTNHAQYSITGLLAAGHENIMVVGDDDQSIYSWRGADLRNILEFEQDYPKAHTVKLEQNYRSVGNVLAAANAVIANNQHRKQKKLFTAAEDGEKIQVYMAADERDEGRWIAGEIEKQRAQGLTYSQMAVFYRTNAQSRMLEDMLLRAGVPYRIVGGTRFFDRAEIRDVMAYLTLIVNPADDIAAKRVINVPRRGIGKASIERIEQFAREMGMTFMEGAELAIVDPELRASTRQSIGEFVGLINEARTYGGDLRKVIEAIVDKSGLIAALQAENTDEARGRVENIQEFLGVVDEFSDTHEDEEAMFEAPTAGGAELADEEAAAAASAAAIPASADAPAGSFYAFAGAADNQVSSPAEQSDGSPVRVLRGDSLADFIEWVRLRTDLDTVAEDGHAVTLMTVHSSKGLEFDCVFVAGMEETLFPHMNSVGDAAGIEEERRLAYVAITRARQRLFLTCAYARQIFGQTSSNPISRFIQEIPSELRQTTGLGSAGFSGTGWEKRGSRKGIAGSGTEAGGGRVFGRSSASGPSN
ncbi:ATP-dependent helicase, partial [Eggerthella sinensis]